MSEHCVEIWVKKVCALFAWYTATTKPQIQKPDYQGLIEINLKKECVITIRARIILAQPTENQQETHISVDTSLSDEVCLHY